MIRVRSSSFHGGICGGQSRAGTDRPVGEYAGSKFLRNMASLFFFIDGATIILTCSVALCEPDDSIYGFMQRLDYAESVLNMTNDLSLMPTLRIISYTSTRACAL
jgi:hypothetical protein